MIDNKIKLNDYDIIILFNTNIWQLILQKFSKLCFKCNVLDEKIISLKCSCKFCEKCLKNSIGEKTNNLFYLNKYEKSKILI